MNRALHLVLAAHVFVTIRYTIFAAEPTIAEVGVAGWALLGGSILVVLLALAGVAVAFFSRPPDAADEAMVPSPAT